MRVLLDQTFIPEGFSRDPYSHSPIRTEKKSLGGGCLRAPFHRIKKISFSSPVTGRGQFLCLVPGNAPPTVRYCLLLFVVFFRLARIRANTDSIHSQISGRRQHGHYMAPLVAHHSSNLKTPDLTNAIWPRSKRGCIRLSDGLGITRIASSSSMCRGML